MYHIFQYGEVLKAYDSITKKDVAIKRIKNYNDDYYVVKKVARHEAEMIRKANNEFVIELLHDVEYNYEQFLVFPLIKSTLYDEIHETPFDAHRTRRLTRVMQMILKGVERIHSADIIHRDLKPDNILVDENGKIKICDFGLAKTVSMEIALVSVAGTKPYQSPEMLLKYGYTTKTDIWSIGCILGYLGLRSLLFPYCRHRIPQLKEIFKVIGTPSYPHW